MKKNPSRKSVPTTEQASRAAELEALWTGAHMLLSDVALSDGGPLAHRLAYAENGKPDADTRQEIENASMYVRTAAELLRLAEAIAFPGSES